MRWYLNEHEIIINSNSSGQDNGQTFQRRNLLAAIPESRSSPQGYDVRVTPVEYRLHYKGIYSSHSTLSLTLQQNDLINNKISFKCLASMRQDVGLHSKQLVVLPPSSSNPQLSSSSSEPHSRQRSQGLARLRRELPDFSLTLGRSESGAHVQHYQRPQTNRQRQGHQPTRPSKSSPLNQAPINEALIDTFGEDAKSQMFYVYEDADSTLGPSIIDNQEDLESYMQVCAQYAEQALGQTNSSSSNGALEFNRADNLEYIQLLRERANRMKAGSQSAALSNGMHTIKRGHSINSLVKSPLYLDELDPLRPLINWPPLSSGKLILLPPAQTIVAIPTKTSSSGERSSSQYLTEQRFVLPPKSIAMQPVDSTLATLQSEASFVDTSGLSNKQLLLDRLFQHLNCTCTDGSLDMKLSWLIDEAPVNQRDTKYHPVRVSPDHRQTLSTISLTSTLTKLGSSTLVRTSASNSIPGSSVFRSNQANLNDASQQSSTAIKIACQATHSILLYSSSEMITFDFNPPPPMSDAANSSDKFTSLSGNVINAASGKFTQLDRYLDRDR